MEEFSDYQESIELSVVMPCLNEAETLETCIRKIQRAFLQNSIEGEVIVADNGSTDGSIEIAQRLGVRLVSVREKGYGSAIRGGIAAARGKYVIMGDADDSYNFLEIPVVIAKLREGNELVMGNRFKGGIAPGAMPLLHRYLGNPVLSFVGRLFYTIPIGDFHCGLRGFDRQACQNWQLRTSGMELASEMVVKAALAKARIAEVPVTLSPDGRTRAPHLRTWQDGWRHLVFLLIHSPRWLFAIPGLVMMLIGLLLFAITLPKPVIIGRIGFDVHTLLFSVVLVVAGFQALSIGVISRIYAVTLGTKPSTRWITIITASRSVNRQVFSGIGLVLLGVAGFGYSFYIWEAQSFGALNPTGMLRIIIPFVFSFLLGFQLVFTGFFISMLSLKLTDQPVGVQPEALMEIR